MTQTLEDLDVSTQFCMFKGEPGTRKSTQALSFPGPQYWFSFDQKMNALAIPMRQWGIDPSSVEFDNYSSWDKARQKLERLAMNCENPVSHLKYKTVVIDSVTTAADTILRGILDVKGGQGKGKRVGGILVTGIEDFGGEAAALMEMMALTKEINVRHKVNIILIAHVIQVDQKDLDGRTTVSRSIVTAGKKPAAKMPGYCDEVYHFDMKNGKEYRILTTHTGQDFARTTLPLKEEILFGDKPLYDTFLKPAISELEKEPKQVARF